MKKFFTLIAVAVMAFAAQAAELTVAEGTETQTMLPVYGFYVDRVGTFDQMIYPADMLTDMVGGQINGLKFYADETGIKFANVTLQLSLKTVDQLGYENAVAVTDATVVAEVTPVKGDTELTFAFNEPFEYAGGNLMVEVRVIATTGDWGSTKFYGVETENMAGYCEYIWSNWGGPSVETKNFLPMATFTYEAGTTPVEPVTVGAPVFQGYTIDGITGYGVGINPTTEGSEIMYRVLIWDPVTEEWVLRTDWTLYQGIEGEIWFENNGEKVRIEAYAFIGESRSEDVAYEFTVATALDELMSGKTVAGVRYFNMAGQEMQQAEGLTIVVTTYTDGTTNAVKVVK